MQAVTMDPAEELPSMLWGLDPIFSAFARLYIADILQMTESTQVPGIYFYNSHPVYKVDVLGTVVYRREREDFFCYGVDDGTGVINCLCWKNDTLKQTLEPQMCGCEAEDCQHDCRCHHFHMGSCGCLDHPQAGAKLSDGAHEGFDPVAELKKFYQVLQSRCRLDIGELIRVRGRVKTSRQQREIMASTFYKVNDPVMVVQISWMDEVLQLYRLCYDKPLHLPTDATGASVSGVTKATRIVKDFLKQKPMSQFRPCDVQNLLLPVVSRPPQTLTADQEAGPSGCQQVHQVLKDVLKILQDEGVVYRRVLSPDQVYHVTERDTDLLITVKDVIRNDCKRDKYAEKGCHILHILSAVRQRHSLNVSKAALQLVLQSLECNSDIISTAENYYTIL